MIPTATNWPVWLERVLLGIVVVIISLFFWTGNLWPALAFSCALITSLLGIWAFTNLHLLTCMLVVMVPLSVKLYVGGASISLPAELLTIMLAAVFLYRGLGYKALDKRILFHPITILLFAEFAWMLVTTAETTMLLVSVKRTLLRLLYLVVFYLLLAHWFKHKANRMLYFVLIIAGFIPAAINTLINHAAIDFNFRDAYLVTVPFFDDHTMYGAFIAILLPFAVISTFHAGRMRLPMYSVPVLAVVTVFLIITEYLSFSRAAWLTVAGTVVLFIAIRLKLSFWFMLLVVLVGGVIAYNNSERIIEYGMENDAVSNTNDLSQQVRSITNLSTDHSNLERLNRWETAWYMGRLKPVTGFGPGTYQFQYGQHQMPLNMTYLSTTNGDKGNAHSEYLTALSENGWPGALLFLSWVLVSIYFGLKVIYRSQSAFNRWMGMAVLLGLFTFYLHGWVNTFLDQEKIAALVFGSLAMLTVMDIERRQPLPE